MTFKSDFRVLSCLFLLLASCAEKKDAPASATVALPSDSLISREKMIHILADVYMVEAALILERNEDNVELHSDPAFYYNGIFKKYHISRARYDENLKYYSQEPLEMSGMYDKVILEIEARQKRMPAKK